MSSQPLTFLTGATGFVGAAVTRVLIAKGHRVRALVRPYSSRKNLQGLDMEVVEGDLCDPTSYRQALSECQYLFHVAADYRIWVPDPASMHRVNVEATKVLMKSAQKAGIQRIVYTSSVATLGSHPQGLPADEATPVGYEDMVGVYKQSKFRAEEIVMQMVARENLPAVIVNPSTPIGPRDIKPTPTGRIITDAIKGRMPAYVDTGLNVAHVDDVAMGHWLAFERGQIGERYILGGEDKSLQEILTIIAQQTGGKPPTVKLPCEVLYPVAFVMELLAHVTRREPMLTIDALRMAKKKMFFSSKKAADKLGYSSRPATEAIKDAIAWFKEKKYC